MSSIIYCNINYDAIVIPLHLTIVKLPRTASATMINNSLLKPPTRTVFRPILATVHSHTDLRDHPNIGLDAITCGPQLVALATL